MTFRELERLRHAALADPDRHTTPLLHAIRSFALARLPNDWIHTQDVAASVMHTVWATLPTLPADKPFGPWVARVTRNSGADYRRADATRSRLESESQLERTSPWLSAAQKAELRARCTSPAQLDTLNALLEGMRLDEAADALNLTVRTLRRRLSGLQKDSAEKLACND